MDAEDRFGKYKYLNLETFRRNGVGMKTPVWFVQDGEILFVQTIANSGKVKRIRNNENVNITPCKMDGSPLGKWSCATAREVTNLEITNRVNHLLDKKYGLVKKMFGLQSARQGYKNTVLEIKPFNKEKK